MWVECLVFSENENAWAAYVISKFPGISKTMSDPNNFRRITLETITNPTLHVLLQL